MAPLRALSVLTAVAAAAAAGFAAPQLTRSTSATRRHASPSISPSFAAPSLPSFDAPDVSGLYDKAADLNAAGSAFSADASAQAAAAGAQATANAAAAGAALDAVLSKSGASMTELSAALQASAKALVAAEPTALLALDSEWALVAIALTVGFIGGNAAGAAGAAKEIAALRVQGDAMNNTVRVFESKLFTAEATFEAATASLRTELDTNMRVQVDTLRGELKREKASAVRDLELAQTTQLETMKTTLEAEYSAKVAAMKIERAEVERKMAALEEAAADPLGTWWKQNVTRKLQ